jgi:hypothetical protein
MNPFPTPGEARQESANGDALEGAASTEARQEADNESLTDSWPGFVWIDEFIDREIPEPPEVIKGLLHQGSKGIIGGGSKSFKTWTLVDLAVSVAAGEPWIGLETTKGKVVYVNLEISEASFQKRVQKIVETKGLNLDQLRAENNLAVLNLRGFNASIERLVVRLKARCGEVSFSLIVLDPLYKLLGKRKENAAEDMTSLFNLVEQIAKETGAAIMIGSHFSKGNQATKDSIDRISGSGVFARDPDTIMTITQHAQEGAYTIDSTLRNLPPMKSFVVEWKFPLFRRTSDLDPNDLKRQKTGREAKHGPEYIGQLLGNEALTSTELEARFVQKSSQSPSTFDRLRKKAEEAGIIRKEGEKWVRGTSISEIDLSTGK